MLPTFVKIIGCVQLIVGCHSVLDSQTDAPSYPWKQKSKYYYSNITEKLTEIFQLGDCIKSYKELKDGTIELPSANNEVFVSTFPVASDVKEWWLNMPKPKQMRVEPFLCENVYNKRLPIFNNTGCQLPTYMSPSAPRCQTKYLKQVCEQASIAVTDATPNHFVLPEADHSTTFIPPEPWLLTARDSLVSMCGQISGPCGLIHTNANCMATGYKSQGIAFRNTCPQSLIYDNTTCAQSTANTPCQPTPYNAQPTSPLTCNQGAPFSRQVEFHGRVFVVAEVDDTYVYHIHLEIMPRIIYHLDFLLANPDVKILFGCDSKKGKGGTDQGLRQGLQAITPLFTLAGLSLDRLIVHKHVLAREIYLPMEGGCQDPVYNTWQVLTMRKLFMEKLDLVDGPKVDFSGSNSLSTASFTATSGKRRRPVMMLLKRSSGSKHTRNRFDLVRQWNDAFTEQVIEALIVQFPAYEVVLYSDRNETLMKCYECQIAAFARADVLIGVHGAGLSNMLYMKPNSAVVEIAPYGNDGRCLLGGGPFSRTAAVMSHNYMMHHSPYSEFVWNSKELTSEFNITRLVVHVHSFLKSINFL